MKNEPDEKIIELALSGNQSAWAEIYRRYHGRVKRIVTWGKWGFRYSEIDEIVQEVFLELLKALPTFRREATLATFLTRLSKNKCISVLRQKGAQKRAKEEYGYIFDDSPADEGEKKIYPTSKEGDPEKALVFQEEAGQLFSALKHISPECKEVIRKRYFDDLSYKEICDQLNLPLGTVCSRLKRCLTRLKEVYSKSYANSPGK